MFDLRDNTIPEEMSDEVLQRSCKDLVQRQDIAILYYLVIFGLAASVILIPKHTPGIEYYMIGFGFAIVTTNWLRRYSINCFKKALKTKQNLPWIRLYSSIFLAALVWGMLLATASAPTPLNDHFPVFLSGVLCLASGGILALSIDPKSMVLFALGILTPVIFSLVLGGTKAQIGLALVLVVYGVGMAWIADLNRKEYFTSVVSELRLRNHIEELTERSELDWLTGLKNRKYLDVMLPKEVRRAYRLGYPLSAMMIDIDHFKRINDTFGHIIGDSVLKETAELILQTCQRESDIVSRFGGEEFCVLLPGMDVPSAKSFAESLLESIRAMRLDYEHHEIMLTASIGGATLCDEMSPSSDWLIRTADDCLYAAKNSGRNTIVWASDPIEPDPTGTI